MADSSSLDAGLGLNLRPAADDAPAVDSETLAARRRELSALYRSHSRKVAGYFRRCGVPEATADELLQETFVNALRGLAQFQGQSKLSTWMWTIARHVLLGWVRSHPRTAEDEPEVDPDSLTVEVDAHQKDVDDCVRRAFAAFSQAHPERAQVVYLAAVEGWTRAELAEFLGRSEHAATEYLSQCKARLRPFIEHCRER